MTSSAPPVETQRFRDSQTPESPRPLHAPQPSNIPVLNNQMDPVFNDTATYNIPHNQNFSPYSETARNFNSVEENDAVQSFFRGAEAASSLVQGPPIEDEHDASPPQSTYPLEASASTTADQSEFDSSTSKDTTSEPVIKQELPIETAHTSVSNEQDRDHRGNSANFFASLTDHSLPPKPSAPQELASNAGAVDYQLLLNTITQSASTAPTADALTAPTTAASDSQPIVNALPSIPGLPPKPPTQAVTQEIVKAEPEDEKMLFPAVDTIMQQQPDHLSSNAPNMLMTQAVKAEDNVNANGLDSATTLYQTPTEMSYLAPINTALANTSQAPGVVSATGERPWTPGTQSVYDQFLNDERRYVTEGIWDRFPYGSRLFVGNLPSEKVTKRDLFHIFHTHGRLAQISIKQAYGFVQFLEAASCLAALQAEQGAEVRGRKIHLEVSKPQKNTRGSGASGGGSNNKAANRRRSRSPERTRSNGDRFVPRPNFSDFRDEPSRRREEQQRSPSPRGYRSRDDFRHSPRAYQFPDPRPQSPAYQAFPPSFPPQAPPQMPPPVYDEDAALQLPRRDPRDVPDVQILILDSSVAQNFINWVEHTFRSKGLRASTIWLSQRLPLQAVVKRQIMEGVQAIVKLIQHNQYTSKVPLQVFDRSAGASNVNFNEYVDLDVGVAADIVQHARARERGPAQTSPQTPFPPRPPFVPPNHYTQPPQQQPPPQPYSPAVPHHYSPTGPPQYQPPRPPQPPHQYSYPIQQAPARHTPIMPTASTPNLQQLLANLGQSQSPPAAAPPPQPVQQPRQADLGGLLSNLAAHQQNQAQPYGQQAPQHVQQQAYGAQAGQQGYNPGQQSNVQNIMDQLARYQR